ncbi:MAG: type II toxin-antitoxin system HicB family antitoxin [Nitrospirota bacterium]
MLFPIFIFKDKTSDYGVIVPGLSGCYSAGSTLDEAIENSREAIELHLEGLVEDGQEIPGQSKIDDYKKHLKKGGIAALVEVDISPFEAKQSERVNVTFPKRLLKKIDKASEQLGMTRSGLLQTAAKKYLIETGAPKETKKAARSVREDKPEYIKREK